MLFSQDDNEQTKSAVLSVIVGVVPGPKNNLQYAVSFIASLTVVPNQQLDDDDDDDDDKITEVAEKQSLDQPFSKMHAVAGLFKFPDQPIIVDEGKLGKCFADIAKDSSFENYKIYLDGAVAAGFDFSIDALDSIEAVLFMDESRELPPVAAERILREFKIATVNELKEQWPEIVVKTTVSLVPPSKRRSPFSMRVISDFSLDLATLHDAKPEECEDYLAESRAWPFLAVLGVQDKAVYKFLARMLDLFDAVELYKSMDAFVDTWATNALVNENLWVVRKMGGFLNDRINAFTQASGKVSATDPKYFRLNAEVAAYGSLIKYLYWAMKDLSATSSIIPFEWFDPSKCFQSPAEDKYAETIRALRKQYNDTVQV
jgi:hypothetical protein